MQHKVGLVLSFKDKEIPCHTFFSDNLRKPNLGGNNAE